MSTKFNTVWMVESTRILALLLTEDRGRILIALRWRLAHYSKDENAPYCHSPILVAMVLWKQALEVWLADWTELEFENEPVAIFDSTDSDAIEISEPHKRYLDRNVREFLVLRRELYGKRLWI